MFIDLHKFRKYSQSRNWSVDRYTSEFTFQFRLCRYLESVYPKYNIELESNINRYGLGGLTKKEIDVDVGDKRNNKMAIELKYIRDKGSYNIGMFSFCEDIKFLEELIENCGNFKRGYCIMFTSIAEIYTEPAKIMKPRNKENLPLYEAFRLNKQLEGTLAIRTGNMNKKLTLKNRYVLNWMKFTNEIWACVVEIGSDYDKK